MPGAVPRPDPGVTDLDTPPPADRTSRTPEQVVTANAVAFGRVS